MGGSKQVDWRGSAHVQNFTVEGSVGQHHAVSQVAGSAMLKCSQQWCAFTAQKDQGAGGVHHPTRTRDFKAATVGQNEPVEN
jgi:hypothetical protein